MLTTSFSEHLTQIPDPRRQNRNLEYPLVNVLTIGFCSILCGGEYFTEMEEFGVAKREFFESFLTLENGIPSHDTFGRVFGLVPPETLMQTLATWRTAPQEDDTAESEKSPVHFDGKTMRGTGRGQALVQLVGAWASEEGLALGQVAVEEGSNETEAIPHLIELLDLKSCVITIDAAGTQKSIAQQILENQGDYVLALKRNHPTLYDEVAHYFLQASETNEAKLRHVRRRETSHGREETRDYYTLPVPSDLYQRKQWAGLKSLGMVIRTWRDQKTGEERRAIRYYLSSLEPKVKAFAKYARSHWSIENSLHWVLDVAFREDDCQIENPTAAANLSAMNRLAVSAFQSDTKVKRGIKTKRKVAGWDEDYLLEILTKALNL